MKSMVLILLLFIVSSLFSFELLSKIEVGMKLIPGEAEKVAQILINVIKAGRQDFFNSFFSLKNVVYYGSINALFIAISLIGVYSSRLLWNFIEKKLFYSNIKTVKSINSMYNKFDTKYRKHRTYKTNHILLDFYFSEIFDNIKENTKKFVSRATLFDCYQYNKKYFYFSLFL